MNTLTTQYVSRLPRLVPDLRTLQLSVENWQQLYAEAGEHKEQAWHDYNDAVDNQLPRALIDELYANAQLFDDIARDTWKEWQDAKKQLLDLMS
jgi:hypothetical protein